jgi:LysR family glycine cleavage system transcriptional activator
MTRLPLTALESFVLAARLGNLSHAATRLNLTVSALSHQIRGLEQRLGQRVFIRGSRCKRSSAACVGALRPLMMSCRSA